jgi:hypothetical protein
MVRPAVIGLHGNGDDQRAHTAAFRTQRCIGNFARIHLTGSADSTCRSIAGGIGAPALHRDSQHNGLVTTGRQSELGIRQRGLPADFLSGRGSKRTERQGNIAVPPSVVLKRDWNSPHLTTASILDGISAAYVTGTIAPAVIITITTGLMAIVAAVMWLPANVTRLGLRCARGRRRHGWNGVVQIGITGLHVVDVVGIRHHPHLAAVVTVSVIPRRSLRRIGLT